MSVKGKCLYPNRRWPSKNKTFAKKNNFTINFIHLIHNMSDSIMSTNHCHCLHLHSHCLHRLHTHSWRISASSSSSFHNTSSSCLIHCIRYTALLKTLHNKFWWDVLPWHYDPHWLNNILIFLSLQTSLNSWNSQFSP